jgi:hypothetical protein
MVGISHDPTFQMLRRSVRNALAPLAPGDGLLASRDAGRAAAGSFNCGKNSVPADFRVPQAGLPVAGLASREPELKSGLRQSASGAGPPPAGLRRLAMAL